MLIEPHQLHQGSFVDGARAQWRALGYLFRHPAVLKYLLPAMVLNGLMIGFLVYGLWLGLGYFDHSIATWEASQAGHWYSWCVSASAWIYGVAKQVLVVLTILFVLPPMYVILMNLNPLSALLASQTFNYVFIEQTGRPLPALQAGESISLLHSIGIELRKLSSFLLKMLGALLLNVVPYVGSLASTAVCTWINIRTSGWGLMTPYYEALGFDYQRQRAAVGRQRRQIWGVGAMFELLLVIPLLNVLALFLGSIAGALLCAETEARRFSGPRRAERF